MLSVRSPWSLSLTLVGSSAHLPTGATYLMGLLWGHMPFFFLKGHVEVLVFDAGFFAFP